MLCAPLFIFISRGINRELCRFSDLFELWATPGQTQAISDQIQEPFSSCFHKATAGQHALVIAHKTRQKLIAANRLTARVQILNGQRVVKRTRILELDPVGETGE